MLYDLSGHEQLWFDQVRSCLLYLRNMLRRSHSLTEWVFDANSHVSFQLCS
ncbi:hypothetical protein SynMVIR181_01117 [Synechococcus sp. MVIR-18-1]|nr:hypothetical protein SynMVIR181_01117 [Synechococcus sp. MVIR-18-1]